MNPAETTLTIHAKKVALDFLEGDAASQTLFERDGDKVHMRFDEISVDFVRDTAIAAYTAAKRTAAFVFDLGMTLVATEPQPASNPQFHRMQEYRQRQERRERPLIESTWRMCPSG